VGAGSDMMSAVAQHTIDPDTLPHAPGRLDRTVRLPGLPGDVRPGTVVA
jgi:hypothetical protein